jgi:hypothetical protein
MESAVEGIIAVRRGQIRGRLAVREREIGFRSIGPAWRQCNRRRFVALFSFGGNTKWDSPAVRPQTDSVRRQD